MTKAPKKPDSRAKALAGMTKTELVRTVKKLDARQTRLLNEIAALKSRLAEHGEHVPNTVHPYATHKNDQGAVPYVTPLSRRIRNPSYPQPVVLNGPPEELGSVAELHADLGAVEAAAEEQGVGLTHAEAVQFGDHRFPWETSK